MLNIERFECQKCGECCKNIVIPVYNSDVERWEKEHRWDILRKVYLIEWMNHEGRKKEAFIFPETVQINGRCPFLSKENLCLINDTKPKTCRNFPLNRTTNNRLVKCKGIGIGKKVDPKIIELNFHDERKDLAQIIAHKRQLATKFIFARHLYSQIKKGFLVYDKSLGKYKLTERGLKKFKKDAEKLLQEARKTGKTIEQITMEKISKITKPKQYKS